MTKVAEYKTTETSSAKYIYNKFKKPYLANLIIVAMLMVFSRPAYNQYPQAILNVITLDGLLLGSKAFTLISHHVSH